MGAGEFVNVSINGGVMDIILSRPERKNALTHAMYAAMTAALKHAEAEPAVRVILLAGSEQCFTAGNDMSDFLNGGTLGDDSPVMQFLYTLMDMAKPVVVAVNGPAVGIGTTLLLHCDFVFVGHGARLQMPFVSLGLCPEGGSSFLLPRLLGHQQAARLLMSAEALNGAEAVRLGIATAVCEDGDTLAQARQQCAALLALPAAAVRASKQLLKAPYRDQLRQHMEQEALLFAQRLSSLEAREAMAAFMEKRKPDFQQFN